MKHEVKICNIRDKVAILLMVDWCVENIFAWNFSVTGKCERWHVNGPTVKSFSNYTPGSKIIKMIHDTHFYNDGSMQITTSFKNEEDAIAFKLRWI